LASEAAKWLSIVPFGRYVNQIVRIQHVSGAQESAMKDSVWQGERVRLRAIEPEDWETFFAWNQDDDMVRRLDHLHFPMSREAVRQQTAGYAIERPTDDTFRFVIENGDGEIVGRIDTHDCDRRVGTFAYGLNVLPEHRRKGYAAEAVRLVLRYYFRELRYQKCTIQIYDFNAASVALHERLGFQREGQTRRMGYTDGRHFDLLLFGITTEEFAARHP
jgi:RimJ/RimL family protein N-acetyltransferase